MADLEDLEHLERLLNRPRSDKKRELVRAVMVQPIGILDRIQRIEMIDLLPEEPARTAQHPAPAQKPRGALVRKGTPPALVDPTLDELQRVEHHRRHLGRLPGRSGFWSYLFRHFTALADWGAQTGALDQGWFPFTFKLGRETEIFVRRTLPLDILPPVRAHFGEVLTKAWAALTKEEYNLLASADLLTRVLAGLDSVPASLPVPSDFLDPSLADFSRFLTNGGRADDLLQAWDRAAVYLGKPEMVRHQVREALRLLLEDRPARMDLPKVVQALLSLRARRLVDLDALVPPAPGEYFPKDSFEAPAPVLAEIRRTVDQGVRQAEVWTKELKEIRKVRWFVPGGPLLETFVGSTDLANPQAWSLACLEKLLLASGPLVVSLGNPHLTAVMTRLDELRRQLLEPERKNDPELPAAVARVTTNLGKNLAALVRTRCRSLDPEVLDEPTEPAPFPLEDETKVLESPEEWGGLTVAEALVQTARVALAAGRILGEGSIDAILVKQEGLEAKLKELLARLDRIAPAEVAAQARGAEPK